MPVWKSSQNPLKMQEFEEINAEEIENHPHLKEDWSEIFGFLEGFRPEPILTVSEWADRHRWLAPGTSREPGRWRTSRVPFVKDIMDALSEHSTYRVVVWKKSAQTAATEIGLNWIGYTMDNSPAAMLCVMPTESQMKRNSKMRITPMIDATPRLSKKFGSNKRDGDNTLLQKDLPGMSLLMAGANSPSGLRSMPVKKIMLDEINGYPMDLAGEGSPMGLAEARTNTYPDYKIYILSTPTVSGACAISEEYDKTDQNECWVPCPHCGTYFTFVWENMWWDGKGEDKKIKNYSDVAKTAHYRCPECEGKIYEGHKEWMLSKYEWRPSNPEQVSSTVIGFHINAMYSPFYSFERMVYKFLKAGNNMTKLNVFTNTDLGLESKPLTDAPKWDTIYHRSDPKIQPNRPSNDVKFITVGVDVQLNRLEVYIIGWGYGKRRFDIDYRVFPGLVSTSEAWDDLDKVVNEFWSRPDGIELPMAKMCVDSSAYTSEVYQWCAKHDRRVVPVKGQDSLPRVLGSVLPVHQTEAGKGITNLMLQHIGSSYMKTELYGYLMLNKTDEDVLGPDGYIHLQRRDERFFKGLVAEEQRGKVDTKGRTKYEWYKIYDRNEPLDTMNYARAAAALMGIDRARTPQELIAFMDELEGSYNEQPESAKAKEDISPSNLEGGYWSKYDDEGEDDDDY